MVRVLKKSLGLLYILFDSWRLRNRYLIYRTIYFFRDKNNRPYKIILGIPKVVSYYSGLNITTEVLTVINLFKISDKIRYFTLNNTDNNDTIIEAIKAKLGFNRVKR